MADLINVTQDTLLPGDLGLPAVAPVYVQGMTQDTLATALAAKTPGQQTSTDQRFWATPARQINDPTAETLILNLNKPKLINYISLDLPHLPHHAFLYYWDAQTKKWAYICGPNGYAIRFYVDGAVPAVIGPAPVLQAHQHPSHYGAEHWTHYDMMCQPFTTSKIRLVQGRMFGSKSALPQTPGGKPAAYSLGVRNLDFGYRVLTKSDVPVTDRKPDIVTERESFTTVTDLLGSPVELSVRENRASDLLNGRMWKSGPQPYPYAVVNLYVDARDSSGQPQVIDEFDVQPVTSGVKVNLYYSADEPPDADFKASDNPLPFPFSRAAGETNPVIDSDGLLFSGDQISYLDIDNQAVQFSPWRPFWMGFEFQPQFSSTSPDGHVIFDCGPFQLTFGDGVFQLGFDDQGAVLQQPFDFGFNDRLTAVIGYDGAQLVFYMPKSGAIIAPADFDTLTCSTLRFGAEQGDISSPDILNGGVRLNAFVLKAETQVFGALDSDDDPATLAELAIPPSITAFCADPGGYVTLPSYDWQDDGSTTNAILRFAASFAQGLTGSGLNPYGFVGGPGDVYAALTWTPITRDFVLRQGAMKFAPTRARYFKFEFTNLAAQPYDYYAPTTTKVQTFPDSVIRASQGAQVTDGVAASDAGLKANDDIAPTVQFADAVTVNQPNAVGALPDPAPPGTLPTEALYATDPSSAQRLSQMGSLYNFHPWQASDQTTRYTGSQQHIYETTEVAQQSRIAYFVAISSLNMWRVDYIAADDTEEYFETFQDTLHLDPQSLLVTNVGSTTNYVTNPSFERDATNDGVPDGYDLVSEGSITDGTISRSNEQSLYGANSMKIAASALGASSSDRIGFSLSLTGMDFTHDVAVSVYALQLVGSPVLRGQVAFYNSSGTLLNSSSSPFSLSTNAPWERCQYVVTPPANTDHLVISWWFEQGDGQAVTGYLDGFQVESNHVTPYCDGSLTGCTWTGSVNASASTRTESVVNPWAWQPGALTTPVGLSFDGARVQSVAYGSKRKVRGLQFASTQSAPTQLLDDPDYDDPTLAAWKAVGDAAPLELSDAYNSTIGSTVKVQRVPGNYWDAIGQTYATWGDIEDSQPDPYLPIWNDLEGLPGVSEVGGIAYAGAESTTKAGRIYAAVRVYSDTTLNAPLVLQILDAETGAVLSEEERDIPATHVTEWWTSYTIGEGGAETSNTWDDVEALGTYANLEIYAWEQLDTTIQPLGHAVTVQLIQRAATQDSWYVDTFSAFEDAIVWEFSNDDGETWWPVYDIRNNPRGCFIFPPPVSPTVSSGTKLMWRVTGYRPNLHITDLAIRPWYGAFALGYPNKIPGVSGGPNLSPTDHFALVENDPRWQQWDQPIPQDWFYDYRQMLLAGRKYETVDTTTQAQLADTYAQPHAALVGSQEVIPPDNGPGPELYEDIYADPYNLTYGLEEGGQIYTDGFGNGTY